MKKKLAAGLVAGAMMFGMVAMADATALYITGDSEPWDDNSNINNMNTAFGGDWAQLTFANAIGAGALTNQTYDYIYVDGGDGQTGGFEQFLNNNRTNLESWVTQGGSLFLNAARWGGTNAFDLGFGATLNNGPSGTGSATDPTHEIFDATTGVSWTGNWFAHDYISGAGLTELIYGTNGAILAGMNYGLGYAMFGGMTNTYYHSPSAQANALRVNIHQFGEAQAQDSIPEPSTMLLFGTGLLGLVGYSRKRSQKTC